MSGIPQPPEIPVRAPFLRGDSLSPEWVGFFRAIIATTPQVNEVHLIATGVVYLGDSATNGSWRIVRSGDDLHFDRRESGAWVNKGSFTA
jgi:hypothetical protein